jgi:processive 1,2-diacylglycerol beta-glucosyltransferase
VTLGAAGGERVGLRRILVLSASAGAGHLRAAEAVEAACRRLHPDAETRHVDVLTLATPAFARLYGKGYVDFVNRAPELLGILYDRTNRPPRHPAADALRRLVDRLNTRPLVALLREFAPDVVCHTHFLPAEIVAREKRRGRLRVPHAVVVTDFDVHRFWLCPGVERYFVAREENRVHLEALGAPRETVSVTGIPIHPVFADAPDRDALRRKHGVGPGRPLLLVLAGGFGVGPVETLVTAVAEAAPAAQVVAIAGRNEGLRRRLDRVTRGRAGSVRVLGFTADIHEWMALATLAVTKPGGLTTSEALAMGLPLVVVNAIPGQETRNATMLFEEGAAMSGENPLTLGYRVARLLGSPKRLDAMAAAARRLGHPSAAMDVARALGRLPG